MIRFLGLIGAVLLWSGAALAQNMTYTGAATPGHTVRCLNSTCTVLGDAGGAGGTTTAGTNSLTEIGITNTGTPFCINDAVTTGPYHALCLGAFSLGTGLITYNAYNGATNEPLNFIVNGSSYVIPGIPIPLTDLANIAGGTVLGNSSGVAAPPSALTTLPSGLTIPSPTLTGTVVLPAGTSNGLLYNSAGNLGNLTTANNGVLITSGSGAPSISTTLPSGLTAPSFTVTTAFTATGLVTNTDLANPSLTLGSTLLTLGGTVTSVSGLTLSAPTLTSPTITGGSINNTPIGATTPNTGAFSKLTAAGTGVFTNTQMNDWMTSLLNGISPVTEFQSAQGANYATEGVVGGIAVPSTATVWNGDAVAGFANSASTTTHTVAGYFQFRSLAASVQGWGINPVISDGGFASTVQNEFDVNCSDASSHCYGMTITGASTVQPAVANAIDIFHMGSGIQWKYGIYSEDGGSAVTLLAGALAASGSNIASQPIEFHYFDGSGTSQLYALQVGTAGNLQITGTGATDLLTVPALNVSGSATTAIQYSPTFGVLIGGSGSSDDLILTNSAGTGVMTISHNTTVVTFAGAVNVAAATGGAASKYVCTDSSGNIVTQSGAC